MAHTFETVTCTLCGEKNYRVIYPADYSKEKDKDLVQKFRASGDELLVDQLVSCTRCGLIYVNPRITGETIVASYAAGADPLFVSQVEAREQTFDKAFAWLEQYVPQKGAVLDVGTAAGSSLAAAKKRGWTVYGCEPNRWLARWGSKHYGLKIKPGTLFEQHYKKELFNVVTLWDVIEHTPDPMKVIQECRRVLKPKGFLVVNYPDIGSWIARLTGRKWLFLTSVHLYYFTPKTMTALLKKAGFKVRIIKPHFQYLELGYICTRAKTYSSLIGTVAGALVRVLGCGKVHVPYWLGQTFVLAQKE